MISDKLYGVMGDHVLDRSTSVSVKGQFVFFFWPSFGLVGVELQF